MITIRLVCVGQLKEEFWKQARDEYKKRLSRYCKLQIVQIDDLGGDDKDAILQKEGEKILKNISGKAFLMAIEGKQYSSPQFSQLLQQSSQTNSTLTFVIGSSYGVSDQVKSTLPDQISFGKATFPHNLAQIMLLEQIYRAFKIQNGESYHK